MVVTKNVFKKHDDESSPNVFSCEYNLNGIPFQSFANLNDLEFIKGNVIRDMNRAIILKPITREKIVEVMVEEIKENVICVPQIQVVDKYVEVIKPLIRYKIKEVKRPVTVEKIRKVTKIVEEEKILEVPEIQYVEKIVEVPQIVHKEKIIEIPLPMVRERRIPVLNVRRKERFEEVEGLLYQYDNPNEDMSHEFSTDIDSSQCTTPVNFGQNREPVVVVDAHSEALSECGPLVQVYRGSGSSESGTQHSFSRLRYFDSKIANYNSSESESAMIEQLSEASNEVAGDGRTPDIEQSPPENKIEIEYELNKGGEFGYPNIEKLSICGAGCGHEGCMDEENNLERCEEISADEDQRRLDDEVEDENARRSRFESRIKVSTELGKELSKKLVENISTQMIPKTLRMVEKRRRIKDKN